MLTKLIFLAALAGLAATNPIARRTKPETSQSRGWKLIANVTQTPNEGLGAEINFFEVTGIHIGPPNNRAVLFEQYSGGGSRIFYTNSSTGPDATQVLTDSSGFSPHFHVQAADTFDVPLYSGSHGSFIQPGPDGGGDVKLEDMRLVNRLGKGRFLACSHVVPYYQKEYKVVDYVYEGEETPEGCVEINLLPQCDELKPIEDNDEMGFSHKGVVEEDCYVDVAAIDWSQ